MVIKGDPETHRRFMREFCVWEIAGGGPDPHMKIAQWIAWNDPRVEDVAWWCGCYIGPYVIATGEVILQDWRTAKDVVEKEADFRAWMASNYDGFQMRRERRAIYGAKRFADHMVGYAKWLQTNPFEGVRDFETGWHRVTQVPGNGRYGSTKLYEVLRRVGLFHHPFPDIRPRGGDSPRQALAWLRPEEVEILCGGNRPDTLVRVNEIAQEEKNRLRDQDGIDLDWFESEVLLCEYKQAYDGGQYPGRAHDSELGRARKIEAAFPEVHLKLWEARRTLFPHHCLGEIGNRWDGRRGLGSVILEYDYTWSDLVYDYAATTDLANPVRRTG